MAYETRLNASITTIVSVTHRTWDRWTVELRVPLAELMIVPKPGEVLRMNIIHNVPVGNGAEVSTYVVSRTAARPSLGFGQSGLGDSGVRNVLSASSIPSPWPNLTMSMATC